ncbi:protein angel homolog 1 isoform X1 [Pygocentrus nattereri]|uniref:Endonuclease/exonuclease/phosphatase domain-containing protein n=1 Tax=Pygocentrus nattereri TaxID=42514 RepID=A0A3B4DNS1_PYGNA|nr:protein angel homolog 1 isoform X1 [Pygocentrus nattereri]
MIGTLIYYALFPLTKLIGRLSESWWKVHPGHPVFINGKEVWDGGGAPFRRLSEQQTALLDQWRSTGSEPLEKPKPANQERGNAEGLVEGRFVLEREVVAEVKKEQEMDLLHKDTENICSADPAGPDPESLEEARAFSSVMEKDASDLPEVKREETIPSGNESDGLNVLDEKDEVEKLFSTIEWTEVQGAAALGSKGGVLYKEERRNHKEMEETTADSQPEEKSCRKTGESEAQVVEGSSVFNLSALLADGHAESLNSFTQFQSVPAGWHFPVGLGLSEAVCYPSVQFPTMSYYPAFRENNSLEVMWRVWEDLNEDGDYSIAPPTACVDPCNKFTFTVMSYNILAQDLLEANYELYLHCSEGMLAWENRVHAILKELQTWEPDIVCLQEVQENHFLEQMHPALIEMGYICIYKQRTGTKTDGCAVCYHGDRFIQLSVSLLEFRRHDCELLDRDNVGIVLLLQPISEHGEGLQFSPICVANTHLLFNPRRGDVKLAQLAIVLAEIDSVVKQCKTKGSDCEVILCGDLNSLPNMPLYQLIATGQLYYHGLPAWMVSGQEDLSYKIHHRRLYAPLWPSSLGISDYCQYSSVYEPHTKSSGKLQYNHDFLQQLRYCQAACVRPADLEFIPGVTDNKPNPEEKQLFSPSRFKNTICHGLNLSSVYSPYIADTERCAVTTLHSEGAAMVDYIFYSTGQGGSGVCKDRKNGLKLLGRLTLLSEADLWSMNGLPNEMFPSDHLSLLAKFQLG